MTNQESIINNIITERKRQDVKWGIQTHSPADWLTILGEEVGEVNKAAYEAKFHDGSIVEYRTELIQVAAVALNALECFDRIVDKVDAEMDALKKDLAAKKLTPSQYEAALKSIRLRDCVLNPKLIILKQFGHGIGE